MTAPLRRVTLPLGPLSEAQLLAWLDAARGRGEPVAAWLDPDGGTTWAAAGAARNVVALDLGALTAVSSTLVEQGSDAPAGLPALVVGGAFDPARSAGADDPWSGWPAVWAIVPERVLWARGGESGLTLHVPAGACVSAARDAAVERVLDEVALAARVGRRPASAGGEAVLREERASWVARVEAALRTLDRGDLQKVVLARGAVHALPPDEVWDVARTLERLGAHDPRALRFALAPGSSAPGARGCFVGATPELLVRVAGRRVETVALAGTCRRGADPADDEALGAALLASAKDRREHALVADAVREALRPACAALDAPAAPGLRRLRHVQHLETRFAGELAPGASLLDLAARLHPTPAVAGTPRPAALEWLRAHEPLARGWYAGAVGFVDATGGGALAVAIRSALLDGPRAWTFAGAGVVPGSDPHAEWEETALKLRTVERALVARPLEAGVLA